MKCEKLFGLIEFWKLFARKTMAGWGIIMLDITFLYLKCPESVNIFRFDKTSWFEFSPFGLWWYELTDKEVCHSLTTSPCYQEWSFKMYRFHKRCWRPLLLYKSWRAFSDPEDDHLQKRCSNLLTEYRQRSRSPQQSRECWFFQRRNVLGVGLMGVNGCWTTNGMRWKNVRKGNFFFMHYRNGAA